MPEFRLEPDSLIADSSEPKDETTDAVVEDSVSKDTEPADERIARLEAELSAQRTVSATQIEELKKAVGRAQSLIDRGDRVSKTEMEATLNQRYGDIHELLASIVAQADPTVFPDTLKEKMAAAAAEAKSKSDREAVVREVVSTLLPNMGAAEPTAPVDDGAAVRVETAIKAELAASGLELDDLDWATADKVWLAGGEGAVLQFARNAIASTVAERDSATRRTARKPGTPENTQAAPGGAKNNADILLDPKASFADRKAVFDALLG